MTSIVGVLCKDGVVVGADSAVTFGGPGYATIEQCTEKIRVIAGKIIVAGTGAVGLNQRFCAIVEGEYSKRLFAQKGPIEVAKALARAAIEDFASTHATKGQYGAFVAFPCQKTHCACEFAVDDFQPEFKEKSLWYSSMGSAQTITDPFLALMRRVFWQDGPPAVADAVFAVNWALEHAIEVNPGGVNGPVRIAVLERVGGELCAREVSNDELQEHRQNMEAAYEALRQFKGRPASEAIPDPPAFPSS